MDFVADKPCITQLELISSGLSSDDGPILASTFVKNQFLKYVVLDHADFGPQAMLIFKAFAENPLTAIKSLSMRYCKIQSSCQNEIAKLLTDTPTLM